MILAYLCRTITSFNNREGSRGSRYHNHALWIQSNTCHGCQSVVSQLFRENLCIQHASSLLCDSQPNRGTRNDQFLRHDIIAKKFSQCLIIRKTCHVSEKKLSSLDVRYWCIHCVHMHAYLYRLLILIWGMTWYYYEKKSGQQKQQLRTKKKFSSNYFGTWVELFTQNSSRCNVRRVCLWFKYIIFAAWNMPCSPIILLKYQKSFAVHIHTCMHI